MLIWSTCTTMTACLTDRPPPPCDAMLEPISPTARQSMLRHFLTALENRSGVSTLASSSPSRPRRIVNTCWTASRGIIRACGSHRRRQNKIGSRAFVGHLCSLGVEFNYQPHQIAITDRAGLEHWVRLTLQLEDVRIVHLSAIPKPRDLVVNSQYGGYRKCQSEPFQDAFNHQKEASERCGDAQVEQRV